MDVIDNPELCDDVLDYTEQAYTEDNNQKIRISNGINLRDLNSDGIVFHPEIDEDASREESNQYFNSYYEEAARVLSENKRVMEQEELEEDLSEFEAALKQMHDISNGHEGVMKRVLTVGHQTFGNVPPNATITIHYHLQLEGQDEPFDSSILRAKPERYKLGDGQLIQGLEIGILTMKKGEKAQFWINYDYAYGKFGCPPRIPAEAALLATVDLLDFVEEGQAEALLAMDADERNKKHTFKSIEKVVRLEHTNGNSYVRKGEWKMALKHYERAIKLILEVSLANREEEELRQKLLLKLQLNTAHCCIKLQWPKKACTACKEALDIDKENTKALFRRGKAERMLEDFEKAKDYLLRAQRRAPQDMDIAKELRSLEDQLARQRNSEKTLCMNMFKNSNKDSKEEKINEQFYNTMHDELLKWAGEPETEMELPAQFTVNEMKALKFVTRKLGMTLKVVECKGSRKIRITKEAKEKKEE